MSTLNKKSLIILFFQLLQAFVASLTTILIARKLGAEDYGVYVYLLTATAIFPLFTGLGSEHVFLMEASKTEELIKPLFSTAFFLRIIITLFLLLIIIGINYNINNYNKWSIICISFGSLLAVFNNPLSLSYFRVLGKHIFPWVIIFIGSFFFLLYVLLAHDNLISISIGFLISQLGPLLFFIYSFRKILVFDLKLMMNKEYIKKGLIFSFSQGFDYAFARLDIFIIQFFSGPFFLGLYAPAQRIMFLFQIIPSSFHVVELPEFHRLSNQRSLLEEKFRALRGTLTEISLLISGCIYLSADYIVVTLFGSEFSDSGNVLKILCLISIFIFISYPYYMLAEALNKLKERLIIRVVIFFTTAVLIYFGITIANNEGAALGLLVGQIMFVVCLHLLTRKANGGFINWLIDLQVALFLLTLFVIILFSRKYFLSINYELVSLFIFFILCMISILSYKKSYLNKLFRLFISNVRSFKIAK